MTVSSAAKKAFLSKAVSATAAVGGSCAILCHNWYKDDHVCTSTSETSSTEGPSTASSYWMNVSRATQNILLPMSFLQSQRTACEEFFSTPKNQSNQPVDPSFPDLSRFGSHSYLKRYLTPVVYAKLKDKTTSNGVTLEDLIRSGTCLPWGANPPRGTAVYAGDDESYDVFADILVPVLEDYHHFRLVQNKKRNNNNKGTPGTVVPTPTNQPEPPRRRSEGMLRRQFTNLNPNYVLQQKLDPSGDYILQTRMRVARSIKGFPFSPVITRAQRRELEQLFLDCVQEDWNNPSDAEDDIFNDSGLRGGTYIRVMDMTNEQHEDLIARHILFHDPDEYNISANIGRDWPDARGIFLNNVEKPDLVMWINKEDHLRIFSMSNGGDLLAVFTRLSRALAKLEESLKKRGYSFCVHPRYGFVNTSPENLGTALRASVFVKLYRLGQQPGFDELLDRLRLEASSRFKNAKSSRYSGIFDIANAERLGQSEVQLINTMINGVGRLIDLEKRLERGEKVNLDEIR
ncbi:arginine kinase [Nitzschia inconspicua]|uniref:Arginine kinase n=1 Tax=Nitzschia inconspicua TaxID=303405 RepID=A0A9K3PLP1_9STRA|nr:arginine kinase [Nitzschia inconspicua]